ncbi:MAG: ubiquinol-cytochrome c reductase iron-sulfur subunit [Vicinamibacterales bacterium]
MMDNIRRDNGDADDPRAHLDVRIDGPGREGLTGTTAANMFKPLQHGEQITIAPNWRPMEEQPAWRTDFPIDWPQDHYVERREFMKFMFLASAAFTAGQFWIAARSWWRKFRGQPEAVRIASVAQVPVGGALTFAYPAAHDDCFLVRTAPAAFLAYGQKCTHLSCAVVPQVEKGLIHCPCHNGNFDLATGRPVSGPPRRPLPLVHIEVRGNDIYATGVEERTV